jgi:acyl-coenzyme A synthetase/AMP-(fatty) acid ligase
MTIDYLPSNRPARLARVGHGDVVAVMLPNRVELLLGADPGTDYGAVLEAAVIGVPHEIYGEVPVAYVVTYPDARVTADELLTHCRGQLTKIKIPTAVRIVPALPKNAVGKTDKPALRASRG